MFPEFLKQFEAGLEKYKVDCVRITATALGEKETIGIKGSKFSGLPYLPLGVEYPKGPDNKPMIMLAQINCEEMPVLADHPTKGIMQFFVSPDWVDILDCDSDNFQRTRVLYHDDLEQNHQTDLPLFTEETLLQSPIMCEHKLSFTKKTEYGGAEDFNFDFSFGIDGGNWFDLSEKLDEKQSKEFDEFLSTEGNKIGGYAYFTQSDPREYNESQKDDVLILQIDSSEHIVIGDVGVIHFFLNREDLKNRNFEKAYFHWDCC